eukprot:11161696-Lingulodinium_polyedra.AAC.1
MDASAVATKSRMPSKPKRHRCVASARAPRRHGRLANSSSHHALRSGATKFRHMAENTSAGRRWKTRTASFGR